MSDREQRLDKAVVDAIRARDTREQGYRAQSLKIHPWVCGRCGREFNEKNLHELTVHHKDQITTTIRPMAATGKISAFTAMTMSTRVWSTR